MMRLDGGERQGNWVKENESFYSGKPSLSLFRSTKP